MEQQTLVQNEGQVLLNPNVPKIYSTAIDPEALAHYSRQLGITDSKLALLSLADAIANSPSWDDTPEVKLIVRPSPQPVIAVMGCLNAAAELWVQHLLFTLNRSLSRLHFVSYQQAEVDCQLLATQLVEHFGREQLKQFHFTAVPRGGLIILGMLAYALDLKSDQLQPPESSDIPWVVVDDCVFTGSRLGNFLQSQTHPKIIFAHLYSHPELRQAIATKEPHVLACLSARDLPDYGEEDLGEHYQTWKQQSFSQLSGSRYWVGKTDSLCFSWNEPDRFFWNPISQKMQGGWRFLPPEICQKNRLKSPVNPPSIQVQNEGNGNIQPGLQVIYGEYGEEIIIGNLETQASFELNGVAADIWKFLVEYGNVEQIVTALLNIYEVDEDDLRTDVHSFINQLNNQGLLR
ncbi:MAG: PqqD family protein [Nostoc sp. TH1S01]|nr:PqqD family protein [Nostoc sp. TH1S01]